MNLFIKNVYAFFAALNTVGTKKICFCLLESGAKVWGKTVAIVIRASICSS